MEPEPEEEIEPEPKEEGGVCDKVDFTEDQSELVYTAFYENKLAMVDLRGEVKKAKISYQRVLSGADSTMVQAEEAAANLAQRIADVITGRLNLRHKIIYNIATVEQRPAALACFNAHDQCS